MLHNLLALKASISQQAHAICPSDMLYVDQNDKSHLTTWNMQCEKMEMIIIKALMSICAVLLQWETHGSPMKPSLWVQN